MNEKYTGGYAASALMPATSEHEDAAVSWARSKEKLLAARNEAQRADSTLNEATKAEVEAWDRLQMVAGRAPPPPSGSMQSLRAY